ncbi:MAG: glycoside hydrolase family 28 protein [Rhodocyclaceae bacterium]
MSPSSLLHLSLISLALTSSLATAAPGVPADLEVPALSADDTSLVLVWRKPENYGDIRDYQVFMNGKLLGGARENAQRHSPAQPWIDKFYASDSQNVHVKVQPLSFTVTGLKPKTRYRFSVRAVLANGKFSPASKALTAQTEASATICDITQKGAVGDGQTLNTRAIQDTIAACPAGGKVRIPAGTFRSGALFLKSNMTLELAEGATLLGSEDAADYPVAQGYKLYTYTTTQRPPSLINALDADKREAGTFRNIRIVGKGVIDGSGMRRATPDSVTSEIGSTLPVYTFTTNRNYKEGGLLAASQVEAAVKEGMPLQVAYGQRRSSLMTLRGVAGLYVAGVTVRNPAFHGIMVLESEEVTINGVTHTSYDVNNGDGLEFGNSAAIKVFNNFIDTGDDCINFAAGTGEEAEKQQPARSAWLFNNYLRNGHGAVVLGSHTGAWIEDVLAEDNVINLTWHGLRAKTNNLNGGGARRIIYRDNAHRDLSREALILTTDYSDPNALLDYKPAKATGQFRDFLIQHNTVEFTANWQPTPVPQGPDRKLTVVDFPALLLQGDIKNQAFHDNIVVDDLVLINSFPIKLDGVRNAFLRNITYRNWKGKGTPWTVSNAPGLKMQDVKLQPGENSK